MKARARLESSGDSANIEMLPSKTSQQHRPPSERSRLAKSVSSPPEQVQSISPTNRGDMTTISGSRPQFNRGQSIREALPRYVGLDETEPEPVGWYDRRLKFFNKFGLKKDFVRELTTESHCYDAHDGRLVSTTPALVGYDVHPSFLAQSEHSLDIPPSGEPKPSGAPKKGDLLKFVADSAMSLVRTGRLTSSRQNFRRKGTSFYEDADNERPVMSPFSIAQTAMDAEAPSRDGIEMMPVSMSALKQVEEEEEEITEDSSPMPDLTTSTVAPRERLPSETKSFHIQRPNVLHMDKAPPPPPKSRMSTAVSPMDDMFYDITTPAPMSTQQPIIEESEGSEVERMDSGEKTDREEDTSKSEVFEPDGVDRFIAARSSFRGDSDIVRRAAALAMGSADLNFQSRQTLGDEPQRFIRNEHPQRPSAERITRPSRRKLTRQQQVDSTDQSWIDGITAKIQNSNQKKLRRPGEGIFGRLMNRKMKPDRDLPPELLSRLNRTTNETPWFTYYMSFMQTLVFLVSIAVYGIAPVSFSRTHYQSEVKTLDRTLITVDLFETGNPWIGPRFADLILLGAKYTPCMRRERAIERLIAKDREDERQSGCCISSDSSECYQASIWTCPRFHSKLYRTKSLSGAMISDDGRQPASQIVCGQDPDWCENPASIAPQKWSENITEWPICLKARPTRTPPKHLACRLVGRPCCIQHQGRCRITTKEYCEFVRGFYHEEAVLCSQVSCLDDVCGMVPFVRKGVPDQISRVFLSLYIHAGMFHLALTLFFQLVFMRDLEQYIGWSRMLIIYMAGGIGGNMASAIFVPFLAEVGPSGSQLAVISALAVDVYYNMDMIESPGKALLQNLAWMAVLLLFGLLPWIDIWSYLAGALIGFLTTLVVFPDAGGPTVYMIVKGRFRRGMVRRIVLKATAFVLLVVSLIVMFIVLFVANPEFNCQICEWINCINVSVLLYGGNDEDAKHFCDNQGLRLDSWLPI